MDQIFQYTRRTFHPWDKFYILLPLPPRVFFHPSLTDSNRLIRLWSFELRSFVSSSYGLEAQTRIIYPIEIFKTQIILSLSPPPPAPRCCLDASTNSRRRSGGKRRGKGRFDRILNEGSKGFIFVKKKKGNWPSCLRRRGAEEGVHTEEGGGLEEEGFEKFIVNKGDVYFGFDSSILGW